MVHLKHCERQIDIAFMYESLKEEGKKSVWFKTAYIFKSARGKSLMEIAWIFHKV